MEACPGASEDHPKQLGTLTLRIHDTGSRWLPISLSRGVDDSPHHWYGESPFEFFIRKLSVSVIRRVVDSPTQWYGESPTQWYGESPTPRMVELASCRLPKSLSRGVVDSAYRWVGESMTPRIGESGSRFLIKISKRKKNNLETFMCACCCRHPLSQLVSLLF